MFLQARSEPTAERKTPLCAVRLTAGAQVSLSQSCARNASVVNRQTFIK
jgi:hypothetical protein